MNNITSTRDVSPAFTSNHNGLNSSTQARNSRYKVIKPEDIKFLDVLYIDDLMCPVSKEIFTDPIQLMPCKHIIDFQSLTRSLLVKFDKTCPSCLKTYTYGAYNTIFKDTITSLRSKFFQPTPQLIKTIQDLLNALPDTTEKVKLNEALHLFSSGKTLSAVLLCSGIIIQTTNHQSFLPILKLMNEHDDNAVYEWNNTVKPKSINNAVLPQTTLPPSVNGQVQNTPLPPSVNPQTQRQTLPPSVNGQVQNTTLPPSVNSPNQIIPLTQSFNGQVQSSLLPLSGYGLIQHPAFIPLHPSVKSSVPVNIAYGAVQGHSLPSEGNNGSLLSLGKQSPSVGNSILQLPPNPGTGNGAVQRQPMDTPGNNTLRNSIFREIKFLDIVKLADLICPISKQIMTDPYQLNPCGHNIDKSGMIDWYANNKTKICPRCSKPYTSTINNLFLRYVVLSFRRLLCQPKDQLKDNLEHKWKTLPNSEKSTHLVSALNEFLSGNISNGSTKFTELAVNSPQGDLYLPIISLMNEHSINVITDFAELVRMTLEPATENDSAHSNSVLSASHRNPHYHPQHSVVNVADLPVPLYSEILTEIINSSSSSSSTNLGEAQELIPNLQEKKRSLNNPTSPSAKRLKRDPSEDNNRTSTNSDTDEEDTEFQEIQAIVMEETPTESSLKTITSTTTSTADNTSANPSEDMTLINKIKRNRSASVIPYVNATNVNVQDEAGNTPLHLTVINDKFKTKLIKEMVKYNVNLDATNLEGQTALHIAAKMNKVAYITLLLQLGASKKIVDNNNKIPSELATKPKAQKAFE